MFVLWCAVNNGFADNVRFSNVNAICVPDFQCKICYHAGTLLVEIILRKLNTVYHIRFHISTHLLLLDKCQ